jgi:exopolysaccharide biosynthesis polyprenyl glycosylphosphotransferase
LQVRDKSLRVLKGTLGRKNGPSIQIDGSRGTRRCSRCCSVEAHPLATDVSAQPRHLSQTGVDESKGSLETREPEPSPVGPNALARARRPGGWAALERILNARVLGPIAAAACCAAFSPEPFNGFLLALLTFGFATAVSRPRPPWLALLPFMRAPLRMLIPLAGTASLGAVRAATGLPDVSAFELALIGISAWLVEAIPRRLVHYRRKKKRRPFRTAVIGSRLSAVRLARELDLRAIDDYIVIGRVESSAQPVVEPSEVPVLGTLDSLQRLIQAHSIDLLVMTSEAPRAEVFEEIARSCLHLPVRLWELSSMYEEAFGHVPVAEIHAAWFQYILHPHYRADGWALKRAIDLVGAVITALLALPMLIVLAWLISRDGGPVLFKQRRVGEGGRPIVLYKLRTMRHEERTAPRWAYDEDSRITPLGQLLRSLHIDELPQLWNVLKGEMSLVGPRPEQPEFVARLEEAIPFYQRRHLLRPGLSGWAQVRCGYAGSDVGSAWKLSHDLYYLKHRSTLFDFAILAETVRTVFADRRFAVEMKWVPFIHGHKSALAGDALVPSTLDQEHVRG